jgi:hypothetical protein
MNSSGAADTSSFLQMFTFHPSGGFNAVGALTQNGNQVLHAGNYNSYALPLSGGTLSGTLRFGDSTNGIYLSGGRLNIRSESTDNVAEYASYGLYLPKTGQTAGLYVQSPIEARGGLRIGSGAENGTITVGADTSATANRLVQRDSGGDTYQRYSFAVHFNQSGGNSENPTIGQIWTNSTSDNYVRKSTPAHFISQLGLITTSNYSSYALPLSGGTMTGQLNIRGDAPTIVFQDTNHRSAMVHVNSNVFYVLRGTGTDSTSYTTYNGYWPMELNLENNNATFGGSINAIGAITQAGNQVLHAGNYTSYAAAASHSHNYIPINPDGDGNSWAYADNNPVINGVGVGGGQLFGADGSVNEGFLQAKLLNAYNGFVNSANGYYVGNSDFSGIANTASTTRIIDGSGNITAAQVQSSGNSGFKSDVYYSSVRNPIWYFGNATAYGISYFQGSAGRDSIDTITLHPNGSTSATGATFATNSNNAFVNNNVVLNASNYTSYSPSLGGSGASGTWGINVTGSATSISTSGGYTLTGSGSEGSSSSWIGFPNGQGIWSPTNGAHLLPNNTGSYGSWYMYGTKNGWYGLHFGSGSTLMMNSNEVGFHREGSGWQMRWQSGTGYVHKGSSGGGTEAAILDASNYTNYVQQTYAGWDNYPGKDANTVVGGSWARSYFTYSNNAPLTGALAHFPAGGYDLQLNGSYGDGTGRLAFRNRNGDAGSFLSWREIIHAGNYTSYSPSLTGSGASGTWGINVTGTAYGLDVHTGRNNEVNKVVRTDANGYIQAGWINTTSGDSGFASRLTRIYASDDAYLRYLPLTDFKVSMGLSAKNSYSRRVDYSSDANYHVGSFGHSGYGANETFHGGSGFFDIWSGTNYPPSTSHIHGFNALHYTVNSLGSTGGNAYGIQVAGQYDQGGLLFSRGCSGGSFSAWRRQIDDNNYNSYSPTLTGGNASGTWGINISGNASNASYGQRLRRNDGGDDYNVQTTWSADISGYWSLRGYYQDGYHAPCYTARSGTASRAQRADGNMYIDDNYGNGVVGVYASTRYQGVFFMGDSYKMSADGTSLSNMYGIGWSHPNAGGAAGNLTDHGMLIINNGGFRCAISNSIVASGNITAYSDERLKTNWRDMPEDYVTRLAQVKVGIYDRIDEKEMSQVGVSAQSFQKLLPEAILTAKDEMQTLSVSYGNAALASAVELAKEVVDLKTRVAQLEALIEKLIKE